MYTLAIYRYCFTETVEFPVELKWSLNTIFSGKLTGGNCFAFVTVSHRRNNCGVCPALGNSNTLMLLQTSGLSVGSPILGPLRKLSGALLPQAIRRCQGIIAIHQSKPFKSSFADNPSIKPFQSFRS